MDKYEIITKIGKGACGAVFLVRNKQDKKYIDTFLYKILVI